MKRILFLTLISCFASHTLFATTCIIEQNNGNARVVLNGKSFSFTNVQHVQVIDGKILVDGKEVYNDIKAIQELKTNLNEQQPRLVAVTQALQKTLKACENKTLQDKTCHEAYTAYEQAVGELITHHTFLR